MTKPWLLLSLLFRFVSARRNYNFVTKAAKLLLTSNKYTDFIDWLPKFATGLNMIIGCSSKSIWVTRLLFCQNGSPMRGSFWQKNSFITHILFELQPIIIFSPVANFGNQSIEWSKNPKTLETVPKFWVFIEPNPTQNFTFQIVLTSRMSNSNCRISLSYFQN